MSLPAAEVQEFLSTTESELIHAQMVNYYTAIMTTLLLYTYVLTFDKINVATINPRRATAEAAIPTIAPTEIPPLLGEDELGLPRKDALGLSPYVAVLEFGELVDAPAEPVWIGDVTIKKSSQYQACS
ncbi:hypothetical protein M422DRAFT_271001 [Sphaerobolus stellatus SS14]|uniref:Uncharacterized protein n=1 Tax=Sphaerobolus stellatus (strain SS14) TaxID=990650 RepID=A0A0C9UQX1_SPHS4|nr:hypothetical protein M422DRAFT_271001 [Sphaerobolus stellatus SS14]